MQSVTGPLALICAAVLALGSRQVWAITPGLLEMKLEELLQAEVTPAPKRLQANGPMFPPTGAGSLSNGYHAIGEALLNFTRFIEWPAEPAGAFRICLAGGDPFGPHLDALANRQAVRARAIRIERQADRVTDCQMVFVPSGNLPPPPARGVLVVAEDTDALWQGAAIVVRLEGGRVVFDINAKAASRVGLKISYKLLRLARSQYRHD